MASRACLGFGLAACLVAVLAMPMSVRADPASPQVETLRQVAGILDYIAGDYRNAVDADGKMQNEREYAEQLQLAGDATALLSKVGIAADDPVQQRLNELTSGLTTRKAPSTVEALCRDARRAITEQHHVDLTPSAAPSRALGETLYRSQGCNTCHGDDGSAQTPTAAALHPHPANFLNPKRVAAMSPHRAYHAITFGASGTAMTSYAKLSDAERWSLAFYVLSLRHADADLAAGKAAIDQAHVNVPRDARALSSLTEEDLARQLEVLPEAQRMAALAYLRASAPFASAASGTMSVAFEQLQRGLAAYRKGDHDAARRAFISAYLDGVEPHEAGLRARDAALVNELEAAMLALRSDAAAGVPDSQLTAAVERARTLLEQAEHGHADANAALIGALTIALREGVEIVLLVAALLGLVRKRGQPELARYVHAGWLLAIPAGLATYYAAESVLSGMRRELAEGVASLVAAVVLLGVTHWLLGQLGSKHWVGFLARRMGAAVSGRRAAIGVLSLSFIAAYREAFEIVLFFEALVRDAGNVRAVWLGAAIGLAILVVCALVVLKLGSRLRPAPFMLASSVCLAVLCFMLLGKGIRALQEAGVVPMTQLPLPSFPWLGFYPTYQTTVAQALLVVALIASAVLPKLSQRRQHDRGRTAPAE